MNKRRDPVVRYGTGEPIVKYGIQEPTSTPDYNLNVDEAVKQAIKKQGYKYFLVIPSPTHEFQYTWFETEEALVAYVESHEEIDLKKALIFFGEELTLDKKVTVTLEKKEEK